MIWLAVEGAIARAGSNSSSSMYFHCNELKVVYKQPWTGFAHGIAGTDVFVLRLRPSQSDELGLGACYLCGFCNLVWKAPAVARPYLCTFWR